MCLLSIAVTPGEWFCSSCQGWSGLCSPLDGQSPEVIPLFSCPNQSPNEEANTWSTQRAGAAFPLLAALRSSLLPWGWAALSVCRIQVYINDTTPKYGLLENSGAGTQHHCSHTNSRHFTYVKKKISKILKTTTKDWTMPNPANAFPKFSSVGVTGSQCCPWEVQPQYCSHPASLHPLQTLHSSCLLFPHPGTALNKTVPTPWSDPDTCRLPQLNQRVEILHLWKFSWNSIVLKKCNSQQSSFCVFCRLPCSQPYQHLKLLSETWMYCWQDNQFKW